MLFSKGAYDAIDDSWVGDTYTMNVITTSESYADQSTYNLLLRMDELGRRHEIWQNYVVDDVVVIILS